MSGPVVEQKVPEPQTQKISTATRWAVDTSVDEKRKRESKGFGHEKGVITCQSHYRTVREAVSAIWPNPPCGDANINMVQPELEDLYDKEKVDLETIVIDDVFTFLQSKHQGLTEDEAARRLGLFGRNELESKEQNALLQFFRFMWNPLSWVMEAAALVAAVLTAGEGRSTAWYTFVGIVVFLFIYSAIGFYKERSAGGAVKSLMDTLIPKAKVKRTGAWRELESSELVPGDVIAFKTGDVVPADCRITEAVNISMDQAALNGKFLPQTKTVGDQCFSGSACKQGEAEGIVISTGANTFFGRAVMLVGQDDDSTNHLQKILAQISSFCLITTGIFVLLEIFILYPAYHYSYRRGLENILVLLIGGIPIAMPTVLSVMLAVGLQQLAEHKAIVTRVAAIEELAGVTILCSDKAGTMTLNKLTIDRESVKTYGPFSSEDVILLASYATCHGRHDASWFDSIGDLSRARAGIKILDYRPFQLRPSYHAWDEVTYLEESSGKLKRIIKGMSGHMIEMCTKNKTEELEEQLEVDVEEFARRGMCSFPVVYEEVSGTDPEGECNGFEFIGLVPLFDPLREDSKQAIEEAMALGVCVKMITHDQLARAKEAGRRLGLGDHMYPSRMLRDGPPPGSRHANLDEMIMDADGFAGTFPADKYEVVKRLQDLGHVCAMVSNNDDDAPALSHANVSIVADGITDVARGAADIVLTEPGLSPIVHAIRGSRITLQRMRNYSIYACAMTIYVVVCFAILAFAYKIDFPPFMVLIIVLLNHGTIATLTGDRVLPSSTPESSNLGEIFAYAVVYGIYLAVSTIVLVVIINTSFFQDTFGVTLEGPAGNVNHANQQLHMIIFLQVAIISQALIFVTRSHSFFFMERPSVSLFMVFCIAQLISSIIAKDADWDFTHIHSISPDWIGIVYLWNIIWLLPLNLIKFVMRATIIKRLRLRLRLRQARRAVEAAAAQARGVPIAQTQGRGTSLYERLYSNRVSFLRRTTRKVGPRNQIRTRPEELERFGTIQVQLAGAMLARNPTRQTV